MVRIEVPHWKGVCFLFVAAWCCAGALNAGETEERHAEEDLLLRPIVYRVPGMNDAVAKRDIVYKRDAGEELKLDIYQPPGLEDSARLPVVIFVHGGLLDPETGLLPKDWGFFVSYGELVAASGMVGVTFNHRYFAGGDLKETLETSSADVADALAYVRKHAADLNADPDRIALWVFSGGGPHLTLGLDGPPPYLRCLVGYYAVLDTENWKDLDEATRARFSPLKQLEAASDPGPPILLARAGLDNYERVNKAIDRFLAIALNRNAAIELINHPEGRHGFDILDDDSRSHDIIARTIEFLRGHLTKRD